MSLTERDFETLELHMRRAISSFDALAKASAAAGTSLQRLSEVAAGMKRIRDAAQGALDQDRLA